ncbi:MAG: nucleotide exchange factor GrpE [Sutterellaceae bacterium]|nr:nucleotide exchange factor GrpE [Sutterellaceae bacterium]
MAENTEKQEVNPAEELKKAAEAAQQASGSQLPPEMGIEPEGAKDDVEKQLADALAKAAENFDLYVRAVAEMDNVRRRSAEDVQKAQKFGVEKFAQNLLPVIDSLEKALEMTAEVEGPMREGLLAIERQFMHAMEVSGMTPVNPVGETFDPNTQQAIAMVPATDASQAGHVAQVFQRGWKIHDRVLRPAMVAVAQG